MTSVYSMHLQPINCLYDDSTDSRYFSSSSANVGKDLTLKRVSNQFRKTEFWLIPPKEPFNITVSGKDIKKALGALHLEKFEKRENN